MNKKATSSFMIVNLVVALFAFNFMINSVLADEGENIGGGNVPILGGGIGGGGSTPAPGGGNTPDLGIIPGGGGGGTIPPTPGPGDVPIGGGGGQLIIPPNPNVPTPNQPPGPISPNPNPGPNPNPSPDDPAPGPGDILGGLNFMSILQKASIGAGLFGTVGALAGGENGHLWGALAGAAGGAVTGILESLGVKPFPAILAGLGVATLIFILTYYKLDEEIVEFYCEPWQAPIGGEDCQKCNDFEHCSEYMCKSLGQACDIINPGTEEQKCVWVHPHDVNSPFIKMTEVNDELVFRPDNKVRPPATGVVISPKDGSDCLPAFFPLEFSFITRDSSTNIGEPSQCKIDYNLTRDFESMEFFVGGNNLFLENHTERLSLPGPDALNAVAPELKNDGDWTLFIRCQDANGNFNQDAYSVSFCVDKGPDTTPPLIVDTNVPSNNPIKFNQTNLDLEVYTNEPSECKWSREDREYENMENTMSCSNQLWEMNNQQVYTCRTTLTGIEDRKENDYYFKCIDQPWAEEGDRNENKQSYLYTVIGTQPLNILELSPNGTIFGATDTIPVFLEITTDNGFENGESLCYYYNDINNGPPLNEEDYVLFLETKTNRHKQRQDLVQGNYNYFVKCVDLGGNAVYEEIKFRVETDRRPPAVIRAYREAELKIVTDEEADCSYSHADCNFEIESGIPMSTLDFEIHTAEWQLNRNYHIRCKDRYNNQPNPNTCSITLRPTISEALETGGAFQFIIQDIVTSKGLSLIKKIKLRFSFH